MLLSSSVRHIVLESRWQMPANAKSEIPRYDAFDDPYCPWGMAAVVNEQRKRKPKRILLPPTRPIVNLPSFASSVTYQKGACDLELTKMALVRNEALRKASEIRRGRCFDETMEAGLERVASITARIAFGLEARRFLDKNAPPFIFAGEPYVLTMLRDVQEHLGFERNPLMLPEPHPAFRKLDAEISTLKYRKMHPHYGIKSDAEYAIIKELRAMPADYVPVVAAASRSGAQRPRRSRLKQRLDCFETAENLLKATEEKLAEMRKAIAETSDVTFKGACKLVRLRHRENQIEARRRALNKLVYADRLNMRNSRRRKQSSDDGNEGAPNEPENPSRDTSLDEDRVAVYDDEELLKDGVQNDDDKNDFTESFCRADEEEHAGTADDTATFATCNSYASGPEMWGEDERGDKVASEKRRQALIFLRSYCQRVVAKRALTVFATRAAALVDLRAAAAAKEAVGNLKTSTDLSDHNALKSKVR